MSLLSDRIKAAMEASGMKSNTLAACAKVTASSVSQWRSGLTKNLDAATCIRAAHAMGVSPLWLADGSGSMHDQGASKPMASPQVMPLIERIIQLDEENMISDKELDALETFITVISSKATIDQPTPADAPQPARGDSDQAQAFTRALIPSGSTRKKRA